MNRGAVKARLLSIIEFVTNEQEKHPTRLYPIKGLQMLQSDFEDRNDNDILKDTYAIEYFMADQFYDYRDIIFEIVMKLCFDIEKMIALRHALDIISDNNNSAQIIQMKKMLLEWVSDYPKNGDIPRENEIKHSVEFVRMFNMAPEYWDEIFPAYIKQLLSRSSGYKLVTSNLNTNLKKSS